MHMSLRGAKASGAHHGRQQAPRLQQCTSYPSATIFTATLHGLCSRAGFPVSPFPFSLSLSLSRTHALPLSLSFSPSHTSTHNYAHTQIHTQTLSLSHSLSFFLSLSLSLSLPLIRAHTIMHTHRYTHKLCLSRTLSLSFFRPLSLFVSLFRPLSRVFSFSPHRPFSLITHHSPSVTCHSSRLFTTLFIPPSFNFPSPVNFQSNIVTAKDASIFTHHTSTIYNVLV